MSYQEMAANNSTRSNQQMADTPSV